MSPVLIVAFSIFPCTVEPIYCCCRRVTLGDVTLGDVAAGDDVVLLSLFSCC